ncbi:hypothetical protein PP175_08160 [Aneurinibacillus sp. Ricciae_BoGa-3]|uniref:hypothetical protein n=1 Tax=Aneurinibacillus sp. Ricciae_BoGa-3 TaxID=3022697 RepID=UPI002340D119|nr:hypothetical protein [Aneurinibacillus sp. Ricciae_BoGa-3]WCK55883.1 hypothetical protein PP175_08160 [Aneurinibacillus sp. Ricciae_BoGa-3]
MNNNNDNRNHGTKKDDPVITNTMVPDFDEVKQVGEEMKHMKTNEELNNEGLHEDPLQATPESARQANDKQSQVKLKRPEQ